MVVLLTAAGILLLSEYAFQPRRWGLPEVYSSYSASIDKPSPAYYGTGETIKIEFNVTDYRVPSLTIASPTQCVFGFRVRASTTEGQILFDWANHANCTGPEFKLSLTPGRSYTASLSWSQLDDYGRQVPPGRYEIMGYFTGSNKSDIETTELVAGAVYFGTPTPVSPQGFLRNYYISLSADNSIYSQGGSVRINEGIANNGQNIDSFEISTCSFSFQVFNLTNAPVFDSLRHSLCSGNVVENPVVPEGSIFRSAYWNQTDDSGWVVPAGLYHVVDTTRLTSGGNQLNGTKRWDILIGSPQNSNEEVDILSSSICSHICPSNGTRSSGSAGSVLSANVRVTGTVRSFQLYFNGVNILLGSNNVCCSGNPDIAFLVPLDNSTVPIFRGGAYDIVVVATFQDGKTSISWANPLLPWGGVP